MAMVKKKVELIPNAKRSTDKVKLTKSGNRALKPLKTTWTEKEAMKEIRRLIEWLYDENPDHFHFGRYCKDHNYYFIQMKRWLKDWPHSCGELFKEARIAQEWKLQYFGLKKVYNDKIAYFSLKNQSGWQDKYDHTLDTEIIINVRDFKGIGEKKKKMQKLQKRNDNRSDRADGVSTLEPAEIRRLEKKRLKEKN